jgi:hypothetical protein
MVEMIRRPLVATEAKRKVVMPPSTADGIATRAAANLLKIPMMRSQKQAAYPAFRLAHRVKAMLFFVSSISIHELNEFAYTPLFCANTDIGLMV